ncbi:MAG TPA: OmpA family protein [Stellaceae bacterium]|nr:OmpA family protein [Stellaceae bacterium]
MALLRGALIGSLLLIAAVSNSYAQRGFSWVPTGLYLRGDVGGAFGNDVTFKDTSTTGSCLLCTATERSSTNNSVIFGGGIGYRFAPMFRADLTLDFMPSFKGRGSTTPAGITSSAEVNSLVGLANGYLDFNGFAPRLFGKFQPYIDAGVGFAHNNLESTTGNIATIPPTAITLTGSSRTNFAWGAGAGLAYAFTPNWAIDVAYKYLDLGRLQTGNRLTVAGAPFSISALRSDDFTVHTVTVGFRYTFAPPPPPPAPVLTPPARPAAVVPQRQQTFIVFFEFDKSSLTPDGKKVVDAAAAAFKSGTSSVAIAGYTDLAGTQQYNLALSKRRADTVKAALVRDGVPAGAINETWHGKDNPRVPTADGVREPQNRRVEINM